MDMMRRNSTQNGTRYNLDVGKRAGKPIQRQRSASLRILLAGCLIASLPGCGEREPRRPAEIQRIDSAGVEVVTIPGPVLDTLPVRSLAREPVLSIVGEQLEEFPLSRIAGALILSDRKIAIADGILDQGVVVGFSGAVLHRFGRRGGGPGEVSGIFRLRRRADDELVVWDEARGRLVVFDTAGAYRETVQTPPRRTAQRHLSFPGFLADGSPVFERRELRPMDRFDGVRRPDFIVDRYGPDGSFMGALASIPGWEQVGLTSGDRWVMIGTALTGGPRISTGGGRAYLGHGDRFEIQVWSERGLERIVRIDRARRVASRSEQKAARDSVAARFESLPFASGVDVSASDVPVGDSLPAFHDLVADAEGGVWMEASGASRQGLRSWVVFDTSGEPTARVHTPPGFTVLDVRGDLVLGVSRDALDVPCVLLYRIVEGASESHGVASG